MRLTQWVTRLERYLHEGSTIPFGWGYCRPSIYRQDYCLIAPIPLNFIIGFGHWFYWRVLVRGWGWRGAGFEDLRRFWIEEGKRRGYNEGYEAGIRHTQATFDPKVYAEWRRRARAFARRKISFGEAYGASPETIQRLLGNDQSAVDRDPRPGVEHRDGAGTREGDEATTHREGPSGMPCSGGGSTTPVSEGLSTGEPGLRHDALDHNDLTGIVLVHRSHAEDTGCQPSSFVDHGRPDTDSEQQGDDRLR